MTPYILHPSETGRGRLGQSVECADEENMRADIKMKGVMTYDSTRARPGSSQRCSGEAALHQLLIPLIKFSKSGFMMCSRALNLRSRLPLKIVSRKTCYEFLRIPQTFRGVKGQELSWRKTSPFRSDENEEE